MSIGFMFLFNSVLLGVGLAMDAFSVSLANGLNEPQMGTRRMCGIAGVFAFFQALMPMVGYLLGTTFERYITSVDHWVAFVLLCLIGGNMLKEGLSRDEEREGQAENVSFGFKAMLMLAVATSIDALAVGITFALLPDVDIFSAVGLIGCTTFCISVAGVAVGCWFGARYKKRAEITGGAILVLLGVRILLEHLGILAF